MSRERYTCIGLDIDGTLIAEERDTAYRKTADAALKILCGAIASVRDEQQNHYLHVGPLTARTFASQHALKERHEAFRDAMTVMDFSVGAVGTEVAFKDKNGILVPDKSWPKAHAWDRSGLQAYLLSQRPELNPQGTLARGDHKLSFFIEAQQMSREEYLAELRDSLEQGEWAAGLVLSGDIATRSYLDLLPVDESGETIHKGKGFMHVAQTFADQHSIPLQEMQLAKAGDGFNDCDSLVEVCSVGGVGIIPANASLKMKDWARESLPSDQLYIANSAMHAAGILEGINHFELFKPA